MKIQTKIIRENPANQRENKKYLWKIRRRQRGTTVTSATDKTTARRKTKIAEKRWRKEKSNQGKPRAVRQKGGWR